jgi:hypothetical protein
MKKKTTKTTEKLTAKDLNLPAKNGNKVKGGMKPPFSGNPTPGPSHL